MDRKPVVSGAVVAVGYEDLSRALEVEFRGGAVYRYLDVAPEAYVALLAAASKGRHVNAQVKGRYAFRRVTQGGPCL